MNKAESKNSQTGGSRRRAAWERGGREHWSQVGMPCNELPAAGPGGDEHDFLAVARTPQKERVRFKRINTGFDRAFWKFHEVTTLIQCRQTGGSGRSQSDAPPVDLCY